jgi:hypothetical protein
MSVPNSSHPVDFQPELPSFDWEDPHPGRRLACRDESYGLGLDQDRVREEDELGGMVGTVTTIGHAQTTRVEQVHAHEAIAPIIIEKDEAMAEVGIISTDNDSAVSAAISLAPSSALTCLAIETNRDWSKMPIVEEGDLSLQHPDVPLTPLVTPYSDLSHYFDWSPGAEDMMPAVEFVDSDSYAHAAPTDDMYGWDAEWTRRVPPAELETGITRDSGAGRGQTHHHRRARNSMNKGSLLERVFSVGKTTPAASNRRPRFMS